MFVLWRSTLAYAIWNGDSIHNFVHLCFLGCATPPLPRLDLATVRNR
jgi:hypothetical protein